VYLRQGEWGDQTIWKSVNPHRNIEVTSRPLSIISSYFMARSFD
jgi:hypothetical protein